MDTLLTLGSMLFGNTWSEAMWMVMKGSAVLGGAWLILQLRGRLSAANRHLVATFALAGMLVLPVLSKAVPSWMMTSSETDSAVMKVATALDPSLLRPENSATMPRPSGAGRLEYTPQPAPPRTPPRQETQIPAKAEVACLDDGADEGATALAGAPLGAGPSQPGSGKWTPPLKRSTASSAVTSSPVPPSLLSTLGQVDLRSLLVVLWGLGLTFLTLRLSLGILRVVVWRRRSEVISEGELFDLLEEERQALQLDWRPRLAVGGVRVPLVGGWISPVILLPDAVYSWTEERQRLVLRHELAHIHRADHLTVMLHQVILTIHWFNPLVWVLVKEARRLCEAACDDLVVSRGARPTTYAAHLLAIAADLPRGGSAPALTVADDEPSELERRICALLDPAISRVASSRRRVVVGGVMTLLLFGWWAGAQLPGLMPPQLVAAELVSAPPGLSSRSGLPGSPGSVGAGVSYSLGANGGSGTTYGSDEGVSYAYSTSAEGASFRAGGTTLVVPEVRLAAAPSSSAWPLLPTFPDIPDVPALPDMPDFPGMAGAELAPIAPLAPVSPLAPVAPISSLKVWPTGWEGSFGMGESDMPAPEMSLTEWGQWMAQASLDSLSGWLVADSSRGKRSEKVGGERLYDDAFEAYHEDRYAEAAQGFEAAARAGYLVDTSWYNAACSYALLGQAEQALVALQLAFDTGWSQPMSLVEDNDFDPIRDHEGFQAFTQAQFSRYGVDITPHLQVLDPRQAQLKMYDHLLKESTVPADVWYSVGTDLLTARIFPQAQDALKRATQAPSGEVSSARYNLACAYALAGQKVEALDELERAVQAGYTDVEHIKADSDLASLRGEARFETITQMAADLSLEKWETWGKGNKFDKKHWTQAAEHFEAYVKAHPTSGLAWFNLGYSLHYSREHLRAVDAFQKSAELGHSVATSYYNIACAYAMLDQKDAALTWLQKAIDAGGSSYWMLEHDTDLDNLRRDARFKDVLATQKKRQGEHAESYHMEKRIEQQLERSLEAHERAREEAQRRIERQIEAQEEMMDQQQELVERQRELAERQRELALEQLELEREMKALEQQKSGVGQ